MIMNLATWNIQGSNTKQRSIQRIKENVETCALTEMKKKRKGNMIIGQYIHFYSDVKKTIEQREFIRL